jgi:hypothetical protein
MFIVEIHGKINSTGSNLSDRLEDLLTSDIFGPLRYLPAKEALIPIFNCSKRFSNFESFSFASGRSLKVLHQMFLLK